jgi:leucyl-tRNA---protein transferase
MLANSLDSMSYSRRSLDLSVERRNFPQFFITAPCPCPYLPDRMERKVFTHLVGNNASELITQLSHGGFRRSQNIAYRPACENCKACVSVRVPAARFVWTKSYRKVLSRNSDLISAVVPALATSEHYSLFRDYIDTRHSDGGMADMTVLDFAAMIDQSVVDSRLAEYRINGNSIHKGELVAAALFDVLNDGISLTYSYYNPNLGNTGLGTFMILDAIRRCLAMGLDYVYLGYWIAGSRKMHYKSRFLPQQRLTANGWVEVP